jgi:hypothetical protein
LRENVPHARVGTFNACIVCHESTLIFVLFRRARDFFNPEQPGRKKKRKKQEIDIRNSSEYADARTRKRYAVV